MNVNCGPPLRPTNCWPSSVNSTVSDREPSGPGRPRAVAGDLVDREFWKIESRAGRPVRPGRRTRGTGWCMGMVIPLGLLVSGRLGGVGGGGGGWSGGWRGVPIRSGWERAKAQSSTPSPKRPRASCGISGFSAAGLELLHRPGVAVRVGEAEERAAVALVEDRDLAGTRRRGR